jgi:hypothetical protein
MLTINNSVRGLQKLLGKRKTFLILSAVIVSLIIDTSIGRIGNLIDKEWLLTWGFVLFVLIAVTYGLGQYFIFSFVRQKSKEIRNKISYINKIHKITSYVQYTLVGIFAFVVLQMIFTSYYYTAPLIVATTVSCSLAVFIMAILAQQFFRWYKSNKNSLVLLYGLSSTLLAIHIAFTLVFIDIMLLNTHPEKSPLAQGTSSVLFEPTSVLYGIGIVNYAYFISAIFSFILMWASTVLLLHYHHSRQKLQRFKFWVIVSLPLVYFLSQFVISHFNLLVPLIRADPISFTIAITLLFTLALPVGGILFAFAFLNAMKNIPRNSNVRNYIMMVSFGFVLFFVSDQTSLLYAHYPPFGLATISFIGLSSYLILLGIYSSATSVAQDIKLRESIRQFTIGQSELLHSIGIAHREIELEKKVIKIVKEHSNRMTQETGVEPSVAQGNIKQYLDELKKELLRPQ